MGKLIIIRQEVMVWTNDQNRERERADERVNKREGELVEKQTSEREDQKKTWTN